MTFLRSCAKYLPRSERHQRRFPDHQGDEIDSFPYIYEPGRVEHPGFMKPSRKFLPMFQILTVGEEVTFPGLMDIKLIVEEVFENRGIVRCKYYDDHLKRFIKLTLPGDALIPSRKPQPKPVKVFISPKH